MTKLRLLLTDAAGIAPYVSQLRELEQSIHYPLGDDRFFIDHGPTYHVFFSGLGQPRFLLAFEGDQLVGSIAGVTQTLSWAGRPVQALYLCDLKVAPAARGRGVSRRMIQAGAGMILRDRELRRTRLFYAAAMRGQSGDVMTTARGMHPFRLGSAAARLLLYFVPSEKLVELPNEGPMAPAGDGVVLSGPRPALESTAGQKDLRLLSGKPWPLIHLTGAPAEWRPNLGSWLRNYGAAVRAEGLPGGACFAIDERLDTHVRWLRAQGLQPGAECTVYWWRLAPGLRSPAWVHMPTSGI